MDETYKFIRALVEFLAFSLWVSEACSQSVQRRKKKTKKHFCLETFPKLASIFLIKS